MNDPMDPAETDCVAGHVGLELRNVVAKHRFERLADDQNMIEALTPKRSDQALRLVRDRKPPRLDFPANSRPAPVQP
jgi:hypothetical protein